VLFMSPFFASPDVLHGGPVLGDPDIWWHLRKAEALFSTHQFIHRDLHSFTSYGLVAVDLLQMVGQPATS